MKTFFQKQIISIIYQRFRLNSIRHFRHHQQPRYTSLHKSFVEETRDGKKIYKVEFEIGDFKENELIITTQGNLLIIKGDREVKVGSTTETKTFNREITVPDYVNITNLNAFLTGTTLTVEAPINNDLYFQRRSAINLTASPPSARIYSEPNSTRTSTLNNSSPSTTAYNSPLKTVETSSKKSTSQFQQSATSHYSSTSNNNATPTIVQQPVSANSSYLISLQPTESSSSYQSYSKDENSTTYKFDLKEFNQTDIHLSVTENKTLEIKASKEINDNIGKAYREFKREIPLDDNVDINAITNFLSDGILTIKIPFKKTKITVLSNTNASSKVADFNNNNINCQEHYSSDGKLVKLTYDLNGHEPENVKIVLANNNELKITAQIIDANKGSKSETKVQKQSFRNYNLPSYIQPEQMRAVMSRDGLLTIDFSGTKNPTISTQ